MSKCCRASLFVRAVPLVIRKVRHGGRLLVFLRHLLVLLVEALVEPALQRHALNLLAQARCLAHTAAQRRMLHLFVVERTRQIRKVDARIAPSLRQTFFDTLNLAKGRLGGGGVGGC